MLPRRGWAAAWPVALIRCSGGLFSTRVKMLMTLRITSHRNSYSPVTCPLRRCICRLINGLWRLLCMRGRSRIRHRRGSSCRNSRRICPKCWLMDANTTKNRNVYIFHAIWKTFVINYQKGGGKPKKINFRSYVKENTMHCANSLSSLHDLIGKCWVYLFCGENWGCWLQSGYCWILVMVRVAVTDVTSADITMEL